MLGLPAWDKFTRDPILTGTIDGFEVEVTIIDHEKFVGTAAEVTVSDLPAGLGMRLSSEWMRWSDAIEDRIHFRRSRRLTDPDRKGMKVWAKDPKSLDSFLTPERIDVLYSLAELSGFVRWDRRARLHRVGRYAAQGFDRDVIVALTRSVLSDAKVLAR